MFKEKPNYEVDQRPKTISQIQVQNINIKAHDTRAQLTSKESAHCRGPQRKPNSKVNIKFIDIMLDIYPNTL